MNAEAAPANSDTRDRPALDAVVVGAGFSGLYMLHRLRELGLSARVYEKAEDVGGTWYWNRYPGARCDNESYIYCYSFSERILNEWEWTEKYPSQSEILDYLRFVADRLDLRKDIQFNTEISAATFNEESGRWEIRTANGTEVSSRFFITAVGCLSKPYIPDFDGLESFRGEWYHTAQWPEDPVDLHGKRAGVIGTGSTGIQVISEIAETVDRLTVFQRTPNYVVPARNRPLDREEFEAIKRNYDEILRETRESPAGFHHEPAYPSAEGLSEDTIQEVLEDRWERGASKFSRAFGDLRSNEVTNETVCEFIRSKIHEIVDDPEVAETLTPRDHPYAAKRPPRGYNGYYETYNHDDVTLVDVSATPIEEITPTGIHAGDTHYDLETIIFATGFDAMTGALLDMDIRGRNGTSLEEKWSEGPRTYLGLAVHGFPNLFTITGPQSPSVLTNMPVAIEHHVEWISDCIEFMDDHDVELIEPSEGAVEEWVAETNDVAHGTVYDGAESWYRGKNIPGKPPVLLPYVGGLDDYREICAERVDNGYAGFELIES